MNDENGKNPFIVPSDEEVFRVRDEERSQKQVNKLKLSKIKIHEKITSSSKMNRIHRWSDKDVEMTEADKVEQSVVENATQPVRGLVAASTVTREGRREKENMTSFLQKKREMFLVQMSLDTKREEIRKLEAKAQLKEEALKKSELMLEEDAIRFDTFLKENDKKAHEAIKLAENETKAKTDKAQEIKKLNQQIQIVQSEMSKLKEQLEDCVKYKAFLDELTPPEYYPEQRRLKLERQQERLERRKKLKLKEYKEIRAKAVAEQEGKFKKEEAKSTKSNKKKKHVFTLNEAALPPAPNVDEMELTSSEEELPMYFQKPQQLLDIFTALEESNLFLIQNSQETEQSLEELKQNFRETKHNMDRKTQLLKQNIEHLREQIDTEREKASNLSIRAEQNTGDDDQQNVLTQLNESVREVYKKCGFDADSNPTTLFMLTDLEARLEDFLSAMDQMPEEYVLKAEKEKEKERRERVRQERIAQQKKMYEERMKKSMERSMQAPKKRRGRQVMWRSQPARPKKVTETQNSTDVDDQADQQFFT